MDLVVERLALKCGSVALIDAGISDRLLTTEVKGNPVACRIEDHRFALMGDKNHRHVGTSVGSSIVMLARLVVGAKQGQYVDHINRDPLDNRVENLRICTNQQNLRNMRSKGGTSKYKGVSRIPKSDRFMARIMVGGVDVRRKAFRSEIAAARQYDEWAKELFQEFAWLNCDAFTEVELRVEIKVWFERQTSATKERFIERAAIMEYDGGLSREEAEEAAYKELSNRR